MLSDYNIDLTKYGAVYDEDDEIWIDPNIDPEKDNEFKITDNILKDFFKSMSDYTEQDLHKNLTERFNLSRWDMNVKTVYR